MTGLVTAALVAPWVIALALERRARRDLGDLADAWASSPYNPRHPDYHRRLEVAPPDLHPDLIARYGHPAPWRRRTAA